MNVHRLQTACDNDGEGDSIQVGPEADGSDGGAATGEYVDTARKTCEFSGKS